MPFSVRTAQRIVHTAAERARVAKPCSAHVLRHTFACLALQRGVSLRTLQIILGHSSIAVTERYLNFSPEQALSEFRAKW
jgi:integrase/recombinase XerD